ncbi:group II intron reverse transcriptase/maturase [Halalkalibacter krulwichiae]|uniref:Group II intron-encoded protein LtrA n=2 Tax=Halalkalibacter krulwichiae TaxID=199441 RepID=A0A1X9MIF8_9BACI|nr:group II intron reverse transcriptase/maturase [Halalkalibacter krulwichiae]ARK31302.1 Group II intron-encoded protein LtrA [Halalkalibacter krulwichiae]ARK32073.1 Group II intron-encoded protein LtrA [Halalkalibacter krulwichiae]
MHRPQKTSKDGYLLEHKVEPEHKAEACSILHAEPRRRDGESSELISEIIDRDNLNRAYKRVKKNKGKPGIDGMTVDKLPLFLAEERRSLVLSIKDGTYQPQPVKRVEIPKQDGSKRKLGIPTVKDRLVQQAILQVIEKWINPHFSENSFGFRPNRSAHDAIGKAKQYYEERYRYVVDIDMKQYFDTVNHDKLMYHVEEFIQDPIVLKLIRKFLRSGIMIGEKYEPSEVGTPQGGNLSPLLSNAYLHQLDLELERRGHKFIRYADDCNIYVKSQRAGERVLKSITKFLEEKLKLTVNKEKSEVGKPTKRKFLGFCIHPTRNGAQVRPHTKAKKSLEEKVGKLTSRKRPGEIREIIKEVNQVTRGWINYYGVGLVKTYVQEIDRWIRRRIRQIIWKRWKKVKTRFKSLIKLKIPKQKAWEWANTRKGYWHISNSFILNTAIPNHLLERIGLLNLTQLYSSINSKHT